MHGLIDVDIAKVAIQNKGSAQFCLKCEPTCSSLTYILSEITLAIDRVATLSNFCNFEKEKSALCTCFCS